MGQHMHVVLYSLSLYMLVVGKKYKLMDVNSAAY